MVSGDKTLQVSIKSMLPLQDMIFRYHHISKKFLLSNEN